MNTPHLLTDDQRARIMEDSAQKKLRSVLTFRDPTGWRAFKAHFVEAQPGVPRIVACIDESDVECHRLPAPGAVIGVAFRLGHKKCMFSCTLQAVNHTDAGVLASLSWPNFLDQVQRRAYERAAPPEPSVVAVRFWPVNENAAAGPRQVRHGQLQDLSAGGMRIKAAESTEVVLGETHQCVFAPRGRAPAFVLEAVLRHREAAEPGRISLGFQFLGLETTSEGRKILHRLARTVSQYQRAHARFH